MSSAQEWSNVHRVAIHPGDNGSSSPRHHASSSQHAGPAVSRPNRGNQRQLCQDDNLGVGRPALVDIPVTRGGEHVHLYREHSHSTPYHDHTERIFDRLGCCQLGEDSFRPLVEVSIAGSHQLEGAASGFPGPSSARQQGTIHHHPNGDGQPDHSCICQSPRRDHIPSALPTRLGDVEVGNRAGSHPDSRPCARQGQYDCGPPLAANQRHGMGASRRFPSATSSSAGTNVHRPFCGTTQCEVEALRELGTGPGCVGIGCIPSGTRDLGGRVCVSAIQPRRTLPGEGKNHANQTDDPGSTGVAATVVVSNPAGDGVGETTAGPGRPSNMDLARDQTPPAAASAIGCVNHLRSTLALQGFSRTATDLWVAAWRESTNNSLKALGGTGAAGVSNGKWIPFIQL